MIVVYMLMTVLGISTFVMCLALPHGRGEPGYRLASGALGLLLTLIGAYATYQEVLSWGIE